MSDAPRELRIDDPGQAGLCAVTADELDAAWHQAGTLGYLRVRIALPPSGDRDALLDALAKALAFPDWFGRNWDALADCLGDLSWLEAPGYLLVFEHARQFHAGSPATWNMAAEILAEASAQWQARDTAFWALTT